MRRQCGGRARFFGDLDQGIESLEAPAAPLDGDKSYEACTGARIKLGDAVGESGEFAFKPFEDSEIHHLPDVGNHPSFFYVLRHETWQGEE